MTMLRARRLASTAVVAVLAVPLLAACGRQSPDVAAYIGGGTITEDRIESILGEVRADLTTAQEQARQNARANGASEAPATPVTMPVKRQDVLNTLLTLDVLQRSAKAHNVQAGTTPSVDQVAQARNLDPAWEYTKLYTQTYQLRSALQSTYKPAELTDADLHDVWARMSAGQATDQPYDQFAANLGAEDRTLLATYKTMLSELGTIVGEQDLKLNPRYGNQQIVLLSAQSQSGQDIPLLTFAFTGGGDDEAYVTDVSAVGGGIIA